ncbi:DNA-directed RNA polymerase III subunit RPC9 [Drosophila eugracilis]|uniref:DNA-directed RNA polymerase III subunit RPC9 n=1 Tax=Drosophila eugracilis TaxID=29029 RepID=UPI0007E77902|nr:DNA-directed RNA polymerase III subunit RPC9 [Drosophila eugracilis]
MEAVNPTFSYLTNLEVMQILQKIKSTKKKFGMFNLATVTYEALQYLEDSPCKTQTRENIVNYVKDLSTYRLKSNEVLQMINDPPTSALHTQLLIDDNKAPLTDEENEKIIQLSYKHFHGAEIKDATKETATEKPAETTTKAAGKQSGKRPKTATVEASKSGEPTTASEATPAIGESNPAIKESNPAIVECNLAIGESTPAISESNQTEGTSSEEQPMS